MVLIFIIFYALLILPQQKKQKKHLEMLRSLKRGDEVVTTGGLHGSVVGLDEKRDVAVLKIADNVKVEVDRGSISRVKSPGS
jgi:preprotein translocase subunit YajC